MTPFFVAKIEDIAVLIDQREQVEIGLGLLTFESPNVQDEDGHNVKIVVSPENQHGISITV